jgi:hypothetical protein
MDDLIGKYRKGFKNNNVATLFNKAANARIVQDKEGMMRHSSKGQRTWDMANLDGEISNSTTNAALYFNDPKQLKVQIGSAAMAASDRARLMGLTGDPQSEMMDKTRSDVVKSAVDAALAAGDPASVQRAKEIVETHGSELAGDGSNLIAVTKSIKAADDKAQVTQNVATIYNESKLLTDMLEETDKIADQEIREETRRQVYNLDTQDKRAKTEFREQMVNKYDQLVGQGMPVNDIPSEVMDDIGPNGRNAMYISERERVSGVNVVTDQAKWQALLDMPVNEMKNVVAADHYGDLHKTERTTLAGMIKAAKKGTKDAKAARMQGNGAIASGAVRLIIGRTPKTEDELQFQQTYMGLASAEIDALRDAQDGKEPSEAQVREINDRLSRKYVVEKPWYRPDIEVDLEEIPADYLPGLSAELRRAGKEVNTGNLYNLYQKALKAGVIK